jgi:hypothetical protein
MRDLVFCIQAKTHQANHDEDDVSDACPALQCAITCGFVGSQRSESINTSFCPE